MDQITNNEITNADIYQRPEVLGYLAGFQDGVASILAEMAHTEWLRDLDVDQLAKEFANNYDGFRTSFDELKQQSEELRVNNEENGQ